MENLEIKVSRKTRMVNLPRQFISVDGENLQSELVFSFIDEFVNGQARLEYEINGKKNYIILNKQSDTYTIPIKNILTIKGQIDMQLVITESEIENGIPVFKSNKFYLYCNESINAANEAPDGYELWIDHANSKLNKIDEIAEIIKTDGEGDKYLSDDGTYKTIKGGTGGTYDYEKLDNKPKINGVELTGNKTTKELGIEAGKEVHVGENEPTDEDVVIWVDPSEEADKIPTKTSELENDSGFITEIPEEYAKKTDIPDVSNFAKKSDIPSIDGLATEEYVNTAIQNALGVIENGTY
jgi:hypothetical protein